MKKMSRNVEKLMLKASIVLNENNEQRRIDNCVTLTGFCKTVSLESGF